MGVMGGFDWAGTQHVFRNSITQLAFCVPCGLTLNEISTVIENHGLIKFVTSAICPPAPPCDWYTAVQRNTILQWLEI